MPLTSHTVIMVFLIVIGVLAFFPLALVYGRDSRPYDARPRRWL